MGRTDFREPKNHYLKMVGQKNEKFKTVSEYPNSAIV